MDNRASIKINSQSRSLRFSYIVISVKLWYYVLLVVLLLGDLLNYHICTQLLSVFIHSNLIVLSMATFLHTIDKCAAAAVIPPGRVMHDQSTSSS
jgi:hypothetical protein